jgi:hypothetical protein
MAHMVETLEGHVRSIPWETGNMKQEPAPPLPECNEGVEAFQRFDSTVSKLLSVPHEELVRREAEYRKQSLANPHRRGPKPKTKRRRAS